MYGTYMGTQPVLCNMYKTIFIIIIRVNIHIMLLFGVPHYLLFVEFILLAAFRLGYV